MAALLPGPDSRRDPKSISEHAATFLVNRGPRKSCPAFCAIVKIAVQTIQRIEPNHVYPTLFRNPSPGGNTAHLGVKSGEIAIPEIQCLFVWEATKVCNLLDSLYHGYPVGDLIAWRNPTVRLKATAMICRESES